MEQTAISCEGTASTRERIKRFVGELSGDPPKSRVVAQGVHRTCGMNSCGSSLLGDTQIGKEFFVGPCDRVIASEGIVAFAIL